MDDILTLLGMPPTSASNSSILMSNLRSPPSSVASRFFDLISSGFPLTANANSSISQTANTMSSNLPLPTTPPASNTTLPGQSPSFQSTIATLSVAQQKSGWSVKLFKFVNPDWPPILETFLIIVIGVYYGAKALQLAGRANGLAAEANLQSSWTNGLAWHTYCVSILKQHCVLLLYYAVTDICRRTM